MLKIISFRLLLILCLTAGLWNYAVQPVSAEVNPVRRVNIPYLGSAPPAASFTPAVFWFGNITSTNNYADVRNWYYDGYLAVYVNIIDRRLWYNPSPLPGDLTKWDSVSLYLKMDGNSGDKPTTSTYRFDAQPNSWENPRTNWQAVYRGNGSAWALANNSFTTISGYRYSTATIGGINNNQDNRGWSMEFDIPFSSLGLASKPSSGTTWGYSVVVHDRDDAAGTPISDQVWPEPMQPDRPSTWGQMHYGFSAYNPATTLPSGSVTIRNGLNGVAVKDGEVGGHSTCGENLFPDIFTNWGQANYAGYDQINIQNQWDLSDWPCFSKYYISFPLGTVPAGKTIVSATISMYLFGTSWGDTTPPDSYIQALGVGADWNPATLSWNNAPLATENLSGTWVHAMDSAYWVLYSWDVSAAAAQAYLSGQPLRLAFYSADGERHTGKYFISSAGQDVGRPTLTIQYGSTSAPACAAQGSNCRKLFLPLIHH